jgi:phosphohistidine phosphatase
MDSDQVIPFNFSPKKLYLLRHSDAEDPTLNQPDFSRKLSNLGKKKVRDFSSKYSSELEVELVLCSTAIRTRETLSLLDLRQSEIQFFDSLYLAEKETILSEIQKIPDTLNKLLIVGHNNGLSDFLTYFTGENIILSTCQMIEIQVETEKWEFVGQETGSLLRNFF